MLKVWKDRGTEALVAMETSPVAVSNLSEPNVKIADTLSGKHVWKQEVQDLIRRNRDVFSASPGKIEIRPH